MKQRKECRIHAEWKRFGEDRRTDRTEIGKQEKSRAQTTGYEQGEKAKEMQKGKWERDEGLELSGEGTGQKTEEASREGRLRTGKNKTRGK